MRRPRKSLATAFGALILMGGTSALADRLMVAPYSQYTRQGTSIDWLTGRAESNATSGVLYELNRRKQAPAEVVMKTEEAARDKLMDLLGSMRVDAASTLGAMDGAMEDLRVLLENAETMSTPPQLKSRMVITLKVPLWGDGGIIALLMPAIDSPDAESTVTDLMPASRQGEEAAVAAAPEEQDPVTGLIVDATKLTDPAPALFGRVIDETGRVIHSLEEADLDAVRQHGLMAYAIKIYSGTPTFRHFLKEGANPIKVEAISLGEANTDFVISSADAERVLAADAASPFLRPCQVLVLLPPVGPMPDKIPQPQPKPPVQPKKKASGVHR